MSFSNKIQKIPLIIRKIILWMLVVLIGIVLIWSWAKLFSGRFKDINKEGFFEEFNIPSLREKIEKDLPKLEIPEGVPQPEIPSYLD